MNKLFSLIICFALLFCTAACGTQPAQGSLPQSDTSAQQPPVNGSVDANTALSWAQAFEKYVEHGEMPAAANGSSLCVYEVFVYSFYDSNGDGIGDLAGLASMLDYIQYMGFNAIWLMPVHPSPTYHKYDVTDYYAIDEAYGTMEDFETLIAECEKRGITVIMDFVFNHTSSEHPWFTAAVQALENGEESPYIDYYNFSDENLGGWHQAAKNGNTTWYYECPFWSGMPDLNLESEAVRKEIESAAAFWLDKGVGGFRLDAVKEFVSGNTPANVEILNWFTSFVKEYKPGAYIVGEAWYEDDTLFDYYESGADSFFAFGFAGSGGTVAKTLTNTQFTAKGYGNAILRAQESIAAHGTYMPANFFTNHDSARAAGILRRNEQLIKLAWGMNILQPGNAFVYYGEELGMSGSGKDENKRAPMFWSSYDGENGLTKGPPAMEQQEHNFESAAAQISDAGSILNYVKNAIALRNELPEIAEGYFEIIENQIENNNFLVTKRSLGQNSVYVAYNLSDEAIIIDVSALPFTTLYASLETGQNQVLLENGNLHMPEYSICILK